MPEDVPKENWKVCKILLELELQMIIRHYIGDGNWTQVFRKSKQCS